MSTRTYDGPKTEWVCCSECDYFDLEVCGHKQYAGDDCRKCKSKLRKYSGYFIMEVDTYPGANYSTRSMEHKKEFVKDEMVEFEVERVTCSKCDGLKIRKDTLRVIDDIYVCERCMHLYKESKKDSLFRSASLPEGFNE